MADTLRRFEDVAYRAEPVVQKMALLWTRRYNVPVGGESGILPAVGDAVDLDGVSGSGIMQPRVMQIGQRFGHGRWQAIITFYQVRPYSGTPTGNGTELNGSRQVSKEGRSRIATRLFATTDGSTDVPSRGDSYPGETGWNGLKCVAVEDDPEQFPGLYLHVSQYLAFRTYGT